MASAPPPIIPFDDFDFSGSGSVELYISGLSLSSSDLDLFSGDIGGGGGDGGGHLGYSSGQQPSPGSDHRHPCDDARRCTALVEDLIPLARDPDDDDLILPDPHHRRHHRILILLQHRRHPGTIASRRVHRPGLSLRVLLLRPGIPGPVGHRRAAPPARPPSLPSSGPRRPPSTASTPKFPSPNPTAPTNPPLSTSPRRRPARRSPTLTTISTASASKPAPPSRSPPSLTSTSPPSSASPSPTATAAALIPSSTHRIFPKETNPDYAEIEERHYAYCVRNRLRREVLVPLRKIFMNSRQWDALPYNRVASVAMKNYKDAFKKHDNDCFSNYLEDVKKGKAKIDAGALLPHEILVAVLQSQRRRDDDGVCS